MKLDGNIFCWYNGDKLTGIMCCFVDDVIWGGTSDFTKIVDQLKETFKIGSENSQSFNYIGTSLTQDMNFNITINQDEYTTHLEYIPTSDINTSDKHRPLSEKEKTSLRSVL